MVKTVDKSGRQRDSNGRFIKTVKPVETVEAVVDCDTIVKTVEGSNVSEKGGMNTSGGKAGTPSVRNKNYDLQKLTPDQRRQLAWLKFFDPEEDRITDLRWLLYPYQRDVYDALINNDAKRYVILCRRRRGKSFTLLLYAIEQGFLNKNFMIRYAAPTQRQMEKIIHPIVRTIIANCPKEHQPKWNSQKGAYVFPHTKSEIHIAGTDAGHSENLRGTASDLNIVDEAGTCSDLDYLIKSILAPQTMTTGGRTILASTPSVSPEHPFRYLYLEAKAKGNTIVRTIYDDKSVLSEDVWLDCVEESGGEETTHFRREYGCEFVVEEHRAIVPEWIKAKSSCVEEREFPENVYPWLDKYVSLDVGTVHYTVALFAVYDFPNAILHIEDEWFLRGSEMTTDIIAKSIREKEVELWGEQAEPWKRISDSNNRQLLQDLRIMHRMSIMAVQKTKSGSTNALEAMINKLRQMIKEEKITIHPRCKLLLATLEGGIWNEARTKFSESKAIGHADAIAALMYMLRHVDVHRNPIPSFLGITEVNHHMPHGRVDPHAVPQSDNAASLRRIFRIDK